MWQKVVLDLCQEEQCEHQIEVDYIKKECLKHLCGCGNCDQGTSSNLLKDLALPRTISTLHLSHNTS